ncbi:type I DNA topoisomerase [Putridiphycobacter roseus]|uniref:DNA topoisomerase 1 n=1 Tax=Putridiphycobacter roseus TaxID=2219161 RepID=A0A2W1NRR5_9FLAO|nr:type I DNA topoisomerase [Putridiphycobacter roseus]PZE18322.1 type I DNA topoisomerase [Putridiphycobacter roseus]
MAKNLVIVESPAKAKTIEGYLGKDFTVMSSYGHVRDLGKKENAIDVENDFLPNYEVSVDKKKIVAELKKLAKGADIVWLATDEDREGEAISWHLKETLGLKEDNYKRITFNEITKSAVTKAIENPRKIDDDLVNAQQARRILDRLVGFELSPVLWRKVKPSLSAGRVQSVAVRLIVEREKEIEAFSTSSYFNTDAIFSVDNAKFKSKLNKTIDGKAAATKFLEACKTYDFSIADIQKKPAKKSPTAPFTTSTLQQEASLKYGFSVSRTMSVAQRLYEAGKITYMRTDSVHLSDTAVNGAVSEIKKAYGDDFVKTRKYKTKSSNAQEAHEAIRPTDFSMHTVVGESDEEKLYQLIWKRAIASQMSDAQLERTTISIDAPQSYQFLTKGEIIKFEGFLKVYLETNLDDDEEEAADGLLPDMNKGDHLNKELIQATERFSRPPSRYVEASLVKKLEELGIGRPSTYAPTISTIQKRGYVERGIHEGDERKYLQLALTENKIAEKALTEKTGSQKGKMIPTDIGRVVTEFLVENFGRIMEYSFTASVEEEFDDIAHGLKKWTEMLKKFYVPFHKNVEDTLENSERATGERALGDDPKTGKPVIARIGRFGPMIQIGVQDDEDKPKFASLRATQSIHSISLEDALELFKFPKVIGEFEDKDVKINVGRFGPYVQHNSKFVSISEKNGDSIDTITIDRAIELIKIKREEDAKKLIKTFSEDDTMQLLIGRWGPYLKIGKNNFKLPKDVEAENLTYEQCVEISENQPAKKGRGATAKKTVVKKAAPKKKAAVKKKAVAKKTTAKKPAVKKTAAKK